MSGWIPSLHSAACSGLTIDGVGAADTHKKLASPAGTYAFTRSLQQGSTADTVVVVLTAPK